MNIRPSFAAKLSTERPFKRRAGASVFACSALATAVSAAWAQTPPADTAVQTIVVTAQKRAEPAQTVPISLYAVTGKQLEDAGVSSVEQLGNLAAGVTVSVANPGQVNITMRGIGNLSGGLLAGPSVGYYVDESPMSAFSQLMPQMAFWDAERVEVLRGPQGTLFGEGSMGGTLRLITLKPDATDLSGRVQLIGSKLAQGGSGASVRGVLNVPLVQGVLALRVGAGHQDLIGWVDYPDLGLKDADKGKQDDARLALRWTPSKQLTLDLSHTYQRIESNDAQATSPGVYHPMALDPTMQAVRRLSPRETTWNLSNLTASYDLGFATVVGSASWFKQDRKPINDLTPIATKFFGPAGAGATVTQSARNLGVDVQTQEVRLVSNGDQALNWTVGAYHKTDKRVQDQSGFDITVPAFGITNDLSYTTVRASAKGSAVFADIDYNLTETLAVQAGVRRYKADNDQLVRFDNTSAIFGTVAGVERYSAGPSSATSPKLGLSWKASKSLMVYGKVAEGFRDGGSNFQAPGYPVIPAAYGPEKVRAYELGIKSQPANWLTINAALFDNRWTDLQLSFLTGDGLFSFIQNAGKAKSSGGEIEIAARPTSSLRLALNLASVDSKIDEDVVNALGLQVVTKGQKIPFSPKVQTSVSASYQFPVSSTLGGLASATYSQRGATYSDPANTPEGRNDAVKNLYLRLGVSAERWSAAAFVNNATNNQSTTARSQFIAATVGYGTYVPPRTVGIELNAQF
jgi:outer membrane receptor protein involved in Fe transport